MLQFLTHGDEPNPSKQRLRGCNSPLSVVLEKFSRRRFSGSAETEGERLLAELHRGLRDGPPDPGQVGVGVVVDVAGVAVGVDADFETNLEEEKGD